MSKLIEDRIREHYCEDGGDWLVEKGKVKEAKLLKEAYHRIMQLRKDADRYASMYSEERGKTSHAYKELERRHKDVEEAEHRLQCRLRALHLLLDHYDP